MSNPVAIGEHIAEVLALDGAVVALESTIFSELGLPAPHNREALSRCVAAVRAGGAEPALTAVLDGRPTLGVDEAVHDVVCGPARKVASRDLGIAAAQRWPYGATTVSASLTLAAACGVRSFATGGIGGVHRGAGESGDVSADLDGLARHQVVTVSAGAKVFLDLPRTVEHLETLSVPILGWRCDEFPAFHARSSGIPLATTVNDAEELAGIASTHWRLGGGGVLVVAPVPEADAVDLDDVLAASTEAIAVTEATGVRGPAVTPAVLERLMELTDGRAIGANLSLAENNAAIAAEIAVALSAV
ncbi:MAG: pseudouridine-5'-phosphate glycosidase [Acidimicrobiales bacterium]